MVCFLSITLVLKTLNAKYEFKVFTIFTKNAIIADIYCMILFRQKIDIIIDL